MNSKISFNISVFLIVLFVLTAARVSDFSSFADVVTTITAIIGAVAIWFQMKRESDIKEAEFVMNYNTTFIENQQYVELEQKLELYRKHIEAGGNPEEFEPVLTEENRQTIINYLVYHEALAVFVKKRVLSLEGIDDLFAYRFFLVMNNPEIQAKELCPEALYYQGCFRLHKDWTKYRKDKGLYILLEETSLEKTDEYKKYANM